MVRSGEVDVLHTHNGVSTLCACLAKERAGFGNVVATQHFITPARQQRRGVARLFSGAVHRWIRPRISRWIAISEAVAQAMRERGDTREELLRVVRNGVSPPDEGERSLRESRRLVGGREGVPLLLCPARLEPEKGHATLLRALEILSSEGHAFDVVFMGGGSLEAALRRRISYLKLEKNVRLVGFQLRPELWMNASDIVVLPSPDEPFGLVLVEAMSRGIPVVAAASGGPLEIMDSECGRFFAPGDSEDLAVQLKSLIEAPLLRSRMGHCGVERYRALFSVQRMAREVSDVYAEALASSKPAVR
jgi:glycosyltransferase involved in cell wall biosynthesis